MQMKCLSVLLTARGPKHQTEGPPACFCVHVRRHCFASTLLRVGAEPSKRCMRAFPMQLHDTVRRLSQPTSYGVVSGINFGTASSTNTSAPLPVLAGGRTTAFSVRLTGALHGRS